ncbi:hypothetical protein [Fibrella forsythiae]|uniref:Uncharacterized protein n=1 Tax=Fibrella forsythiae TaxID=2817061 RepID=A0ABS3JB73_9BACT|nr:hypothetical protein [Fibrella forsythiae]MBO0947241.1 hypothetical protein [Fibrella forsythiae]
MNQPQQPASDVQGSSAATEPVTKQPLARSSFSLTVGTGKTGDGYGTSQAELIGWAITEYKRNLYQYLVRAVKDSDEESLIEAGVLLASLDLCDETLIELVIGLQNVAIENFAIIQSLGNTGYTPTPEGHYERYYTDKVTKLFTR